MPIAPTKRDWSSNSATGAVCERCMASITVFSDVPGVAQKTCARFLRLALDIGAGHPDRRLAVALGRRHQPVGVDLEARRLAPVEPHPAIVAAAPGRARSRITFQAVSTDSGFTLAMKSRT